MSEQFLRQIEGRYKILERGVVLEGPERLSMYFPPIGLKRDLRAAEIDEEWVAKFDVELSPGSAPFPLEPKIEDAIYRVAGTNRLFCDRIDVEPDLFITDHIDIEFKLDPNDPDVGKVKALNHKVTFFNSAGTKVAEGRWICPICPDCG
jgi:hypothetical protein